MEEVAIFADFLLKLKMFICLGAIPKILLLTPAAACQGVVWAEVRRDRLESSIPLVEIPSVGKKDFLD